MAQLMTAFDATVVEPAGMSSALPVSGPEGYGVIITNSELVPVKDKPQCGMLALTLQIIDGEHKGDTGTYRLNLYSDNQQACQIAERQLSAICHAVNVFKIADSAQLHNLPFRVVVGPQKVKAGEEDKGYTEVKGVLRMDGSQPGKPAGSAAPVQQAAPPQPPPAQPATQPAWGAPAPAQEAAPAAQQPAWGQPAAGGAAPPWAQPK